MVALGWLACTAGTATFSDGPTEDSAGPPPPLAVTFDGLPPKNLIMLSIDTLRRDHVGRYDDGPSLTPFLDELSSGAFVLDDFLACSNWTVASTACVLTGASNLDQAAARGMVPILLNNVLSPIPNPEPMLGTWLGEAGYSSLFVTSNGYFSRANGNAQGFDEVIYPGNVSTEAVWEATRRGIDPAAGGTPLAEPFYLHLHFFEPHRPYLAPDEYLVGLDGLPELPFDLATVQGQENADTAMANGGVSDEVAEQIKTEMRLRYEGEVRWLDDQLRQEVFQGLEALGLLEDALVVLWTDHGEELWDHGPPGHAWMLHGGENDAVALFWAENVVPGTWTGPTDQVDLAPTVLEILGVEGAPTITGLAVGKAPADRARFSMSDGYVGPVQAVVKGDHKLHFRWADDGTHSNLELFDLASDPAESQDLYDPAAEPSALLSELWGLLKPQVQALEPWIAEDPRGFTVDWPPNLP